MTDLVLRDLAPGLAGRIRQLAELQGRSVHDVMAEVLETGVHACEVKLRKQLDIEEERALKEAILALERVPDDAGFGLIGRL
jgi:plasmid stability protein